MTKQTTQEEKIEEYTPIEKLVIQYKSLFPIQMQENFAELMYLSYSKGQEAKAAEVRETIQNMKGVLWNDDVQKHATNITRYNTLNEVLSALSDNKE